MNPAADSARRAMSEQAFEIRRLEAEIERLRAPFKHADALDWNYLQRLLLNAMRSQEDSQTRFWIETVKELRGVVEQKTADGAQGH